MIFDKFKDTIFIKKGSELENKLKALEQLYKKYPNNDKILEELFIVRKGLEGEKEIEYQLNKSNIGLYVLHDINIEWEDMKAQIDYVVISKACTYFIECKNLIGNVTINSNGDFIREYSFNNKTIKKGMYSPLRQVEAQRDVFKKIWNTSLSNNKLLNTIRRALSEKNFKNSYKVLVVIANRETILNNRYAPSDMKYKVIKSDNLIRQIEYDINNYDKDLISSPKAMEEEAEFFNKINVNKSADYYKYYYEKFLLNDKKVRNELIKFRRERSAKMNIPLYYIFNNEELDNIILLKPKSIDELKKVLPEIKVKVHGEEIIKFFLD